MSTKEYLSKTVPTVKELLESQGYKQESEALQIDNVIFDEGYDGYGDPGVSIIIEVKTRVYVSLKKRRSIEESETIIRNAFSEATKGNHYISAVTIRPNSNVQTTLLESGTYQGWRNGYFRMFISHIALKKKQASNLKVALEEYGITSFVAHEDVNPTRKWIKEIQRALNSMDCMSAMMYDGFHQSNWCDQEVGIALGRGITVLPLLIDDIPYGFLGEYQGIKIKERRPKELSREIFKILCDNPNTRSKYLAYLTNLLLSADNLSDALKWLNLIEQVPNTDTDFWKKIQSHMADNDILQDSALLEKMNAQFLKYKIQAITKQGTAGTIVDDILF